MAVTKIATPKKFSMQQVFEILLQEITTSKVLAYLEDVKTSGVETSVEMTYPTGGRGNTYIGGGFSHSKKARVNVTSATWNTEVMAIQNGTQVKRGVADVVEYEILDVTGTTAVTKFTAKGTANAEIGYVYILNADGTYDKALEQGTTATTGKFTYTTSSKTLTFTSADVPAGTKIACAYTRATTDTAQLLEITTDGIPETVMATCFGLAKDECSGQLFRAQIKGKAQIDGNYNLDLASDGDPAVHSLNLEFVRGCGTKTLYDFTIYTDEE